ncbi:MAG: PD-(D/E)XK nuclease family protein [Chloroflexi bacterium]|nr:PD-(D/E)XK nuclease family protein [Chloroflexota bacterium]
MPTLQLRTLSQSSLQDYADCPRRFQLRYLEQLQYPAVESEPALENEKHQQEGETFHRLVQQHLIGIPAEQVGRLATSANLSRWWENYLQADLPLDGYTTYPEVTLSAPLGAFRLVAKYDLIAVKAGRALIYDWKTYRKRPKNEWLAPRWQTRVYRALLGKAGSHLNGGQPFGPEQISMTYWFAEFPAEPAILPYNAGQFQRDWDALVKLAGEIATTASFPLTEERQRCGYCPYRGYCDRGVRAGDAGDAEAEMEAEELFDVNFEQIGEIAF